MTFDFADTHTLQGGKDASHKGKMLRRLRLLIFVFVVMCCREKIYIADEYLGQSLSDDTISEQENNTDNEVNTAGDSETGSVQDTGTSSVESTDSASTCEVPAGFSWTSSEPIVLPPSENISIKDPTVVSYNGGWIVYATSIEEDLNITYLGFEKWDQANSTVQTPVYENESLAGYKAAPQLFYFAPQALWYLVYQNQDPAYSTTKNPNDVLSWSAPTQFMPTPSILLEADAIGFDYWVICDDTDCYMFFSADNGVLYRAKTTKDAFPEGFAGTTEIVMADDDIFRLFNGCSVYKLAGTEQYLLLVMAIGSVGRYYRSWVSDRLDGDWTPLADTEDNSFASLNNVTGADWSTTGIEHGEMLRTDPDETMTIDACRMRYLFSGFKKSEEDPEIGYSCLGLLTPNW